MGPFGGGRKGTTAGVESAELVTFIDDDGVCASLMHLMRLGPCTWGGG